MTEIDDPFGHRAKLLFNAAGGLEQITDAQGLTSVSVSIAGVFHVPAFSNRPDLCDFGEPGRLCHIVTCREQASILGICILDDLAHQLHTAGREAYVCFGRRATSQPRTIFGKFTLNSKRGRFGCDCARSKPSENSPAGQTSVMCFDLIRSSGTVDKPTDFWRVLSETTSYAYYPPGRAAPIACTRSPTPTARSPRRWPTARTAT